MADQTRIKLAVLTRLTSILATVLFSLSCRAGWPTEPSSTTDGNLREAPADAFTVSNSELTIKFWYVYSPPRNSRVSPGQSYSISLECRYSAYKQQFLVIRRQSIVTDGSESNFLTDQHATSTFGCGSGGSSGSSGTFPPSFSGLREVRIQAWLTADGSASATGEPLAVVTDAVGWTAN